MIIDRPASSASETKLDTAGGASKSPPTSSSCCNCFIPKKRWSDSASGQMSDVYCRTCDEANSPACLANITPKKSKPKNRNILNVESEIEIPSSTSAAMNGTNTVVKKSPKKDSPILNAKKDNKCDNKSKNGTNNNKNYEEYELADDATSLNGETMTDDATKIGLIKDFDSKLMIRVQGKEELPVVEQNLNVDNKTSRNNKNPSNNFTLRPKLVKNDLNGNLGGNGVSGMRHSRSYSTLPKRKRPTNHHSMWYNRPHLLQVPSRMTPDGTQIYYWCNLSKKTLKGLKLIL